MRCKGSTALLGLLLLSASGVTLAAWEDWWQTPEQRAAEAFEQGDHERVLQEAPDAGWSGVGHYQAGDYDAAAKAFAEQVEQSRQLGNAADALRNLYNQGVSDVQAGRLDEAIERFDTVLESDPGFTDAAKNRDIAEQLKQLQQQPPPSGEDGQSDPSEQGENAEQREQQASSEQGENGETGEQGEQGEQPASGDQAQHGDQNASAEPGEQGGQDSSDDSATGAQADGTASAEDPLATDTQAQRQAAAEAAQRALDAEAQQMREDSADEAAKAANTTQERLLSETEQAGEQLLRRIPDDPAGLLRRRLEQSHRNEYPEVRDGLEAW